MISYLQIDRLTKSIGDRMLFQDVTLGIYEGDKIGLIAQNGAGKTTFLNIMPARKTTTADGLYSAMTSASDTSNSSPHSTRNSLYCNTPHPGAATLRISQGPTSPDRCSSSSTLQTWSRKWSSCQEVS